MKKSIHKMTYEEAKEVIENFYAKIPQEKVVKLAQHFANTSKEELVKKIRKAGFPEKDIIINDEDLNEE